MEIEDLKDSWQKATSAKNVKLKNDKIMETVTRKHQSANKSVNRVEWILICAYSFGALIILSTAIIKSRYDEFAMTLMSLMAVMTVYIVFQRRKRKMGLLNFDRNMKGELEHALFNAKHQARLSFLSLLTAVPVIAITWIAAQDSEYVTQLNVFIPIFFITVFIAGIWEHRTFHLGKLRRLKSLKNELLSTVQ